MDEHFRSAPWADNLPVLMGLLGVWNINFLQLPTLAVLPYDDRLKRFPAYLQQLEMESNGKSVTLDGQAGRVRRPRAVIWGEPGDNAQHSFFQLLHQGTPRAALDFLLPAQSSCGDQAQQNLAIANCLAQARGLHGRTVGRDGASRPASAQKLPPERIAALIPHKVHPGSRPSTIVLFEKLDPATLGQADRALRAQGVHAERGLGHQRLRSVGRGAGQEARRAAGSGRAGSRAAAIRRRRRVAEAAGRRRPSWRG